MSKKRKLLYYFMNFVLKERKKKMLECFFFLWRESCASNRYLTIKCIYNKQIGHYILGVSFSETKFFFFLFNLFWDKIIYIANLLPAQQSIPLHYPIRKINFIIAMIISFNFYFLKTVRQLAPCVRWVQYILYRLPVKHTTINLWC